MSTTQTYEENRIDELLELGLTFVPTSNGYYYERKSEDDKKYINIDRIDIKTYNDETREQTIKRIKNYMK